MADETNTSSSPEHDDFDIPIDDSGSGSPPTAPGGPDAATAPGAEAGTADPAARPEDPNALPAELTDALRAERLAAIPGETAQAAYARLTFHLARKNESYGRDLRRAKDEHRQALAELRESLRPMLVDHYNRQRLESLEAEAAQIPPRDSPEYQIWLNEEILRRDDERRAQEAESAKTAEQQAAEEAYLARVEAMVQTGYAKVQEGLGLVNGRQADPEFTHAYDVYSAAAMDSARLLFPGEPPEKIQEFIALSQRTDILLAEANGLDYRDMMKARLNGMVDLLVRAGLVTRAQAKEAVNGNGAAASGAQLQPQQPAPGAKPSPTVAQRVTAEAQAAARRTPSAVPATSRPAIGAGQLPDSTAFDNYEDYVEAALDGILGSEEQRASPHRKTR